MSTPSPSDVRMKLRVMLVNIQARFKKDIDSIKNYCKVFEAGAPETKYGITDHLDGLTKEGIRIAIDIMNEQIKENPEMRELYKALDDVTINYSKAYAQTKTPDYVSNPNYRGYVDSTILKCDVEYGKIADKIRSILIPLVSKRLAKRKSDVKVKLTSLQNELNKHKASSRKFRKNEINRTAENSEGEMVAVFTEGEKRQIEKDLINLENAGDIAINSAEGSLKDITLNFFPDLVRHNAEQAVVYAIDYRFARGKKTTSDAEIVEAYASNPELNQLIKALQEHKKLKESKNKPTPPTGGNTPKGNGPKKKK